MLLGELAESFLAASENSFSANTLRAYRYDLNSLAKAFPEMEVSEAGVESRRRCVRASGELTVRA